MLRDPSNKCNGMTYDASAITVERMAELSRKVHAAARKQITHEQLEAIQREQAPWRAFGDELGLLFQIVDDILDGDGYVLSHGADGARALADEAAERARILARARALHPKASPDFAAAALTAIAAAPFLSDWLHRALAGTSVHLAGFPVPRETRMPVFTPGAISPSRTCPCSRA